MSDDNLKLDLSNAKIKINQFSRGRMKITIKLDKAEAEGYTAFKKSVLPQGASEEEFVKTVFFMGLELFHKNAIAMLNKYVDDNEDKLREEGVDIDTIREVGRKLEQGELPSDTEEVSTNDQVGVLVDESE